MRLLTILAAAALLPALAGCDRIGLGGGGGGEESVSGTIANGGAAAPAAAPPAAAPADAGVTTSRSFASLRGGEAGGAPAGDGGKDPAEAAGPGGQADGRRAQVVGRWADDGDCDQAVDFRADGSFRTADGRGGYWAVAGDVLTISGAGTFRLRLQSVTRDEMVTVNEEGAVGRSTRC